MDTLENQFDINVACRNLEASAIQKQVCTVIEEHKPARDEIAKIAQQSVWKVIPMLSAFAVGTLFGNGLLAFSTLLEGVVKMLP